ncbi:MAG: Holliday junction resolvase Hjc [Candidatus Methanodesulfokora sp.]|jgi:Holliday junction resolvase|nr:MAG: Holliday junction resolvase [Candidatus Korarchaeota archaeon]
MKRGVKAERDLLDLFWSNGIAALRVAGSGSTGHPASDLIAGINGRFFLIEVKTTSGEKVYLDPEEVKELEKLSSMMGAEAWVAVKFKKSERGFYLIKLSDIESTGRGYGISIDLARKKGIKHEVFINIISGRIAGLDLH